MGGLGSKNVSHEMVSGLLGALRAKGWMGSAADVLDVLEHGTDPVVQARRAAARLGFLTKKTVISQQLLKPAHTPGIVFSKGQALYLSVMGAEDQVCLQNLSGSQEGQQLPRQSKLTVLTIVAEDASSKGWKASLFNSSRGLVFVVITVAILSGILSVIYPLLTGLVLSQVKLGNSVEQLSTIGFGVVIYIISAGAYHFLRDLCLNFLSCRIGFSSNLTIMRKLLLLPYSLTETAPISSQLNRLRDFNVVQEFVSGQPMKLILDLPVIITSVIALLVLSPLLASIPIVSIGILLLLSMFAGAIIRMNNDPHADVRKAHTDFVSETFENLASIQRSGLAPSWFRRFNHQAQTIAMMEIASSRVSSIQNAATHALLQVAGVGSILLGLKLVQTQSISSSDLMVCLLLTWRCIGPTRSLTFVLSQISRIRASLSQMDKLLRLDDESRVDSSMTGLKGQSWGLAFDQVSFRYQGGSKPALLGVSFRIEAGETLLIGGSSGSGKSTVLKLLQGLYTPQTGRIFINDCNLRQFAPRTLRRQFCCTHATPHLVGKTIREYFSILHPTAAEETVLEAFGELGLLEELNALPLHLDTPFSRAGFAHSHQSFLKRMQLARLFLEPRPVWLLDDPLSGVEDLHSRQIRSVLDAVRGLSTIVLTSSKREHAQLADMVLWVESSRVQFFGSAEDFLGHSQRKAG